MKLYINCRQKRKQFKNMTIQIIIYVDLITLIHYIQKAILYKYVKKDYKISKNACIFILFLKFKFDFKRSNLTYLYYMRSTKINLILNLLIFILLKLIAKSFSLMLIKIKLLIPINLSNLLHQLIWKKSSKYIYILLNLFQKKIIYLFIY